MHALMSEHRLSQRRACQAAGLARSTQRYARVVCDDSGVIDFIQRYVALNPRHGFGLLYDSARYQAQPWGKTVLWRVYCHQTEPAQARQEAFAAAHQAALGGSPNTEPGLEL